MNKKFTFMVAALLAAGGFSAFAQTTVDKIESLDKNCYYHLVLSSDASYESASDNAVSMTVGENDGAITYGANTGEITPADANLWSVKTSKESGKTVVTLVNKATGKALAFFDNGLLTNLAQYAKDGVDTTLDIDEQKLEFINPTGGNAGSYELKINSSALTVSTKDATDGGIILLVAPKNVDGVANDVTALVNLGEGINLTFEGSVSGTDVFEGLTVVPTGSGVTTFYLVKGKYNATDESKNTYVVLSAESGITGVAAPNGCKYITVKGDKLKDTGAELKKGEYPKANATFSLKKNVNEDGKIALKQTNVYAANDGVWSSSTTAVVYVSASGNTGAALVNAQTEESNAAWLTPSLGTAVDVKSLVKGQWVVNILASEDKNSTEMKKVVYSSQVQATAVKVSASTEETNEHKDAIYAQWIVSAEKDANTVTFINRETGKSIANVTLFKTPKANVYTTNNATLNTFIELRTVENTTQWDGYLKLDAADLNSTEYTLGVDAGNLFEDVEAKIVASEGKITKSTNEDDKALTFKLVQSKQKVNNVDKLDTMFVNVVKYNYYKDGKLTEAADTLKAIQYNFAGLVNAGKDAAEKAYTKVTDGFVLSNASTVADGKFIFRKVGDRYQIAKLNPYYSGQTLVTYADAPYSAYAFGNMNSDYAKFSLNPVAVAPSYDVPESHIALQINGAYLGSKADGNAIMTNDTSMLKSTVADAAFSFYAFSADKEEAKTPSYYLSSNGKMMNDSKAEIDAINKELAGLSEVFDAEKIAELKAKKATYYTANEDLLVKFQQAKYVDAEHIALAKDTVKGDALKSYKFNVLDVDGQAVLKNANAGYVQVLNDAVVFTSDVKKAAKFDVVAAEAPTSNEGVSATEVKVVANNGSVVVKNAAGKNVVVSTILGQVVANEVLTSDNATINVPAGIVVVAVEGESFKVNVK